VFIPQKRTSSTSKLDISFPLWVIIASLDPDPADQNDCRSGSESKTLGTTAEAAWFNEAITANHMLILYVIPQRVQRYKKGPFN
jgi:hypothetical protein